MGLCVRLPSSLLALTPPNIIIMPCYETGCEVIPSPERVKSSADESPLHVRTVVNCTVKSLLPKLNCPPPQNASKVNLLLESFLFFLVLKQITNFPLITSPMGDMTAAKFAESSLRQRSIVYESDDILSAFSFLLSSGPLKCVIYAASQGNRKCIIYAASQGKEKIHYLFSKPGCFGKFRKRKYTI